jgi:glycosyltransferase involved in cell wall biosynthesis
MSSFLGRCGLVKILLLDHSQYITAGLPKTIEVAESLAQRGHQVTLVATSLSNKLKVDRFHKDGVEYVLAPSILWGRYRNGADLWDVWNRISALRSRTFDLIHGIDCRPTVIIPSLYLSRRCKSCLILDWEDYYAPKGAIAERSSQVYQWTLGQIEHQLDTRLRKYADGHIVVSEFLRERLIELGVDSARILVNHFGSKYADAEFLTIPEARQRIGLPADRFILAYGGNLFKADELLFYRTLSRLPRRVKENMTLLVIGTKIGHAFENLGFVVLRTKRLSDEDFFLYLSAANAFILPFRTTVANLARWPSKFSDFCSIGRPIISTPVSELPAIYKKYAIGIMTFSDDEAELTAGIVRVFESPQYAQDMGIQAKEYARKEFGLSAMAERISGFYETILSRLH